MPEVILSVRSASGIFVRLAEYVVSLSAQVLCRLICFLISERYVWCRILRRNALREYKERKCVLSANGRENSADIAETVC